jgi:hypothetical protein
VELTNPAIRQSKKHQCQAQEPQENSQSLEAAFAQLGENNPKL